jgi:hypothetical protein
MGFSRRQSKDEPAMTRVHATESKDVAKKRAIGIGIFAIDDYVSSGNHHETVEPRPKRTRLGKSTVDAAQSQPGKALTAGDVA